MTGLQTGLFLFALMLCFMALRVPIAFAMFLPGAIGMVMLAGTDPLLAYLKSSAFARFSNYDLSVIPMFLLMGEIATHGQISRSLFSFGNALIGHLRGGIAMAAIVAAALFGGICGSSVATTATISQVALPELRRARYSARLSTGTLAAGGVLGIVIPPSVVLVIYAIMVEQNIAKLFAAATIPGLLAAAGYLIATYLYARLFPAHAPVQPQEARIRVWTATKGVWPMVLIFVVMLVGIYAGFFTPTEGAAVGAASTLFLALARRELDWAGFKRSLYGTATTCAMVFIIFLGADVLNAALAFTQLPAQLSSVVLAWGIPPVATVAAILAFYALLGCVMDELAIMLLTLPILFPVVQGLDLYGLSQGDKAIWFGVLVLSVVGFGLLAPPVGLNVYVVNSLAKNVPMTETYRGVIPFLIADVIRISLLLTFPGLCLWLTRFVR